METSETLVKLCGKVDEPMYIEGRSSTVLVVFYSDGIETRKGWKLKWASKLMLLILLS